MLVNSVTFWVVANSDEFCLASGEFLQPLWRYGCPPSLCTIVSPSLHEPHTCSSLLWLPGLSHPTIPSAVPQLQHIQVLAQGWNNLRTLWGFPAKPPFLKDGSPTADQRHYPPQWLMQGLSLPSTQAGQTPAQDCSRHRSVNALLVLQTLGLPSRLEKMMPLITGASAWLQGTVSGQDPEFRVAVTELILLWISFASGTLYQCQDKVLEWPSSSFSWGCDVFPHVSILSSFPI